MTKINSLHPNWGACRVMFALHGDKLPEYCMCSSVYLYVVLVRRRRSYLSKSAANVQQLIIEIKLKR